VPYEFNESDFSICHDLIIVFLDEYPDRTPWDAMRYLIAEANYGGRVTDDWDRRLVNCYIESFFRPEALTINKFPLSALPDYFLPEDGPLSSYMEYIRTLPMDDHPAAFGQHPNADISSQILDTAELLLTISELQPKTVAGDGESQETVVLRVAKGLEDLCPAVWNMREVKALMESRSDPDPLKTVLLQEIDRYNILLKRLHVDLRELQLGVQGLTVITPALEQVMYSCLAGKVPAKWNFAYPSLKPLGSWMPDLVQRIEQFNTWATTVMPKCFWLSGFTYPGGMLTAMLQTTARKNGLAIDTLQYEFPIINQEESNIAQHPKEGAYIKGIFLEGARWDF